MKKKNVLLNKSFLIVLLVVLMAENKIEPHIFYYKEQTGDRETIFSLREEDKGNEKWVYAESNDESHIFILDGNLATTKWIYYNKKTCSKNVVERDNNVLNIITADNPYNVKKIVIDNSPWYQLLEVSLSSLVLTNNRQKEFWIIRPTDFKIFKMVAYKEKEENLKINNKEYNSIKIVVSLTGIASMFWQVSYWFDKKNGLYLKYEGKRGGPFVPKTIVELYRIEPAK